MEAIQFLKLYAALSARPMAVLDADDLIGRTYLTEPEITATGKGCGY